MVNFTGSSPVIPATLFSSILPLSVSLPLLSERSRERNSKFLSKLFAGYSAGFLKFPLKYMFLAILNLSF